MDIGGILKNAILSPDQSVRNEAEAQLEQAAKEHFIPYLGMLTEVLADPQQQTEVRMLAGIALKNQISAKDPVTKQNLVERWIGVAPDAKNQIKVVAASSLISPNERVANSAAQLLAAIADIELPRGEWPELMSVLVDNTKPEQPVHVKRASLLAIGYICETADPGNPGVVSQSSGILTAIIQGATSDERNEVVRLTALNALVNSLKFVRENFDREGERNYIMQVVCEATQASSEDIQAAAFGALARIMSLYYPYMKFYMEKALFGLTVSGMQSADETVACMAVEFWSTVCEEEIDIALQQADSDDQSDFPQRQSFNFALQAIQQVLPTLLNLLTRQDEDTSDDDWNVSMAAGACLQLYAQNTANHVVDPTLGFVELNISSVRWEKREAAVMAFGSILDGPDQSQLKLLIGQALPSLLNLMSDSNLQVKDTVAWCLGRMADLVIDGIDIDNHLPGIIAAILSGLSDHPKVSTNCCWTVMNLTEQLGQDGPQVSSTPMSKYYETLVPALLQSASRIDNENSSRTSAYEALSTLVIFSAGDDQPIIRTLSTEILGRLEATLAMQHQIVGMDDRANLEELQSNLLGLLTNIIRRLGNLVAPAADSLMTLFLSLLQNKLPNSLIEEDIFIAVGSVAGAIGEGFATYIEAFMPFLTRALEESDPQTCSTAIGFVADISHSMGALIEPYCQVLMKLLVEVLRNDRVNRDIKPMILSCFGDIASSIGPGFRIYLEAIMQILSEASKVQTDASSSLEFSDYVTTLQEAIVDAYVGIVAGMRDSPDILLPYVQPIFEFLSFINADNQIIKSEIVLRSVIGLIGDIASMYPRGEVKQFYQEIWISEMIKRARANKNFSSSTKDTARWAREQQKKLQS